MSDMWSTSAFLPTAAFCSARSRSEIDANIAGTLPLVSRCSMPWSAACMTDQTSRPSAHKEAALHITCSSTKQVTTSAVWDSRLSVASSAKVGYPRLAVIKSQPQARDAPVMSDSGISSCVFVPRSPKVASTASLLPPLTATDVNENPMRERRLTPELSDAGGPQRPNRQQTWPARIRSSDFVSPNHSVEPTLLRYFFGGTPLGVAFVFGWSMVGRRTTMEAVRNLCPGGGDEGSSPTQSLIPSSTEKARAFDGTNIRNTGGSPASLRRQLSREKLKTTLQAAALVGAGNR